MMRVEEGNVCVWMWEEGNVCVWMWSRGMMWMWMKELMCVFVFAGPSEQRQQQHSSPSSQQLTRPLPSLSPSSSSQHAQRQFGLIFVVVVEVGRLPVICVLTVESCRGVTCDCFRRKRWKRKSIGDCGAHCLVQYWWPGKLHGHCALGCPYRVGCCCCCCRF